MAPRQRKAKNKKRQPSSTTTKTKNETQKNIEVTGTETSSSLRNRLTQIAIDFPLISASLTVGFVVAIFHLYFIFFLQYPPGFLRPAITEYTERQLLVVGTMGSGTTQVAHELHQHVMEVAHEAADASHYFCRDGTVSWFHGFRYLTHAVDIPTLCRLPKMGIDARMFTHNQTTSCVHVLLEEWNCVQRKSCPTPFRYTLWQTRHPLRTMESLVVKFCDGTSLENGVVHPAFLQLNQALFPHVKDWEKASCVEAAGMYILEYSKVLLEAGIPRYAVEDTSLCSIAKMAGLTDPNTTIYAPNYQRVTNYCKDNDDKVLGKDQNRRNRDLVTLGWDDLRGGYHNSSRSVGDDRLVTSIKELTVSLGYGIKSDEFS